MPVDIRGSFLKSFINDTEAIKGGASAYIYNKIGTDILIGASIYPEETCINVIVSAAEYLYGNTSEENLFEIGKIVARVNSKSFLMKTALKIAGDFLFRDSKFTPTFIHFANRSMRMFSPSLDSKFENPDENTLKITFYNTKMPPKIFEGEWYEFFIIFGCKITTSSTRLSNQEFTITVKSESFLNMENYLKKQEK